MQAPRIANIADQLTLHGKQRPTQLAIVHGERTLDYRALDFEVNRRAARLQDLGVTPGAVVGIALQDSIEHLLMLYGVARVGGVILPLDCNS